MTKLIMLKGLPASGKSTHARELLKKFGNGNAHRANSDDLRLMLDNGEWSPQNEKFVNKVRDFIVRQALAEGKHAIVDNCNVAPKHEPHLRAIAKECGAEFEVVDFTHISVEECIKRDRKRSPSVGEKVIRDMYRQFLAKPAEPAPDYDLSLPDIIICDLDGTLARMVSRGPFEWDKVGTDEVRWAVREAVLGMAKQTGAMIMFLSGRDAVCYRETESWITDKATMPVVANMLHMRPVGDMRKDSIVKAEIYEREIKGKFNVLAVFDDRMQINRTWRDLGLGDRLFRVGPVDEDDF